MKDMRLFVFIGLVVIASVFILKSFIIKNEGVIVTSVESNSACKDIIKVNSIITEMTGIPIRNSNDFNEITKNLKGSITFIIDDNPKSCIIPENSSLSVTVRNVKTNDLKLSVNVDGGTYFLFKPEKETTEDILQNILSIIKTRMDSYDLINTIVSVENNSIKIVSGPEEEKYIKLLTEQGILEGNIIRKIDFTNKKSEFTLNESVYEVLLKKGNLISINGTEYKETQSLNLNGVTIRIENISSNTTVLSMRVFSNKDLSLPKSSITQANSSRIIKQDSGYVFVISVILSDEAGKNFAKITAGQEVLINPTTGEGYLSSPLVVSIDGNPFINLPIRSIDAGKPNRELILWKYEQTAEAASDDMVRLKTLMDSDELPVKLKLVESGDFNSPTQEFYLNLLLYGGLSQILFFSVLFFIRYKKNGIIIFPLILFCLGEVVLITGTIINPWFILPIFFLPIGFVALIDEKKSLISWFALGLMFIMSFGIAITKLILDVSSVVSILVVMFFTFALETIIGDKILSKPGVHTTATLKLYLEKVWLVYVIILTTLLILFFSIDALRSGFVTIFIGILSVSTLTTPVYLRIIEKFSKI